MSTTFMKQNQPQTIKHTHPNELAHSYQSHLLTRLYFNMYSGTFEVIVLTLNNSVRAVVFISRKL